MLKGVITVMLQPNVLDVQGQAVEGALKHLGFESVEQVRIGRQIEMILPTEDHEAARLQLSEMGKKLLANPVIEDFQIDIKEA
ncbi:MAG: phosphoribosylformylglycinamidine synthase subunit PurS [SAR324 cluster bacterium]|uniref:Phosphoribosylformylglycinamidine synthase subunit PurS n=1 Tax=SAR324 cluster bacterium TaxID=2024889 RepID=A0A2D6YJ16_9DELT|nr:phosphoribosylformylglycinamidine synthase subunit PurS [SAR324 cluster bacterium]|tara:strand:- start:53 stop:301 length:249 start_codon:yes stop_codon:yes gene_type:complete